MDSRQTHKKQGIATIPTVKTAGEKTEKIGQDEHNYYDFTAKKAKYNLSSNNYRV
jgi:hypothetical protein